MTGLRHAAPLHAGLALAMTMIPACSAAPEGSFVDAVVLDASTPDDVRGADVAHALDAGRDALATHDADGVLDAFAPTDAWVSPDATSDAAYAPDSPVLPDAAAPVDAVVSLDAGSLTRPIGVAVDVTGDLCALDEAGNFWCWGRWASPSDLRFLGSAFDRAFGSCAMRGHEVWCAEFTSLRMIRVVDGSVFDPAAPTLLVDTLAEYSDLDRGCGLRSPTPGWYEAVCWTSGGSAVREGALSDVPLLVAVSATIPRMVSAIPAAGGREAYDVNPPATCTSNGVGVSCDASPFSLERPAGDHYVLGFASSCAHQPGQTFCGDSTVGPSIGDVIIADDGAFHDHAVAWPIGTVDAVRPWRARGICIGGAHVRCYSGLGSGVGTLAYMVDW